MDGVLLDSEIPAFDLLRNTLEKKGVAVSLDNLLVWYTGLNSSDIYAEIIKKYGFNLTIDEFRSEHKQCSGNYYKDAELIPMQGMLEFLDRLQSGGIRMAVVSSTNSRNVLFALNRLSILQYFDAIVCGDMVEKTKPSPEGYLKAARYLQVEPGDCVIIEDSPIGIQAAKNAGIIVIGYKGSEHTQDTSLADAQVASYDELLEWVSSKSSI